MIFSSVVLYAIESRLNSAQSHRDKGASDVLLPTALCCRCLPSGLKLVMAPKGSLEQSSSDSDALLDLLDSPAMLKEIG